jgi:hypothetical protein
LAGSIEIPKSKKISDGERLPEELEMYESERLDLGVFISSLSFPWTETKTITFSPRFVIRNASHRPIVVTQTSETNDKQFFLTKNEEMTYFFEKVEKNNRIKIRELEPEEDPNDLTLKDNLQEEVWSSNFSTEDIEDFQVAFDSWPLENDLVLIEQEMRDHGVEGIVEDAV